MRLTFDPYLRTHNMPYYYLVNIILKSIFILKNCTILFNRSYICIELKHRVLYNCVICNYRKNHRNEFIFTF